MSSLLRQVVCLRPGVIGALWLEATSAAGEATAEEVHALLEWQGEPTPDEFAELLAGFRWERVQRLVAAGPFATRKG